MLPNSLFSQLIDRALERALPTNIIERNDGFDIQVRVPGVAKKDITVDIQGHKVRISVQESQESSVSTSDIVHLTEFSPSVVGEREFHFRDTLDADSASIELHAGILTLHVGLLQRGGKRTLTFGEEQTVS